LPNNLTELKLAAADEEIVRLSAFVAPLLDELGKVIIGQRELLEGLLIGLLCQGHILIEGVPGLAKTLTVNSLAKALNLSFHRIQFTPDLLPADLLGTPVFHPGTATFDIKKGPIFANLVLADEINRAPAKAQSALLEAMEERQVTLGDTTYPLPKPFFVLATQNPLDHEGTYPLPEAQIDRFLLKLLVDYPQRADEERIVDTYSGAAPTEVKAQLDPTDLAAAAEAVNNIYLDPQARDYLLDLVAATRDPAQFGLDEVAPLIEHGVSPRGSIFLARAARAQAFLRGRSYVIPDDILSIAPAVLRHRLILSYEAEAEAVSVAAILQQIFSAVPRP
jgi:MoxR-like ATPase